MGLFACSWDTLVNASQLNGVAFHAMERNLDIDSASSLDGSMSRVMDLKRILDGAFESNRLIFCVTEVYSILNIVSQLVGVMSHVTELDITVDGIMTRTKEFNLIPDGSLIFNGLTSHIRISSRPLTVSRLPHAAELEPRKLHALLHGDRWYLQD